MIMMSIKVRQGKPQELVLVRPSNLALRKLLAPSRRWWGICDFGNEKGSRSFGNTIDEHPEKRDLEKYVESQPKSKENTLAITEPKALLVLRKPYSREVRFELSLLASYKSCIFCHCD